MSDLQSKAVEMCILAGLVRPYVPSRNWTGWKTSDTILQMLKARKVPLLLACAKCIPCCILRPTYKGDFEPKSLSSLFTWNLGH